MVESLFLQMNHFQSLQPVLLTQIKKKKMSSKNVISKTRVHWDDPRHI